MDSLTISGASNILCNKSLWSDTGGAVFSFTIGFYIISIFFFVHAVIKMPH